MQIDPDDEEISSKDIKEGVKAFHNLIDKARDKIHSFKRIRFVIKLSGIIGMFAALFMQLWLVAVLLWIMFFPDLNEIVKYFKSINRNV